MCRYTIYKGRPTSLENILILPKYGLLSQSRDASYHPGVHDPLSMRNIRVNGDGFGIAWYSSDSVREDGSCTFKISTPVWSDKNLQRLGHFITAPVIMGHIRAASDGYNKLEAVVISHENCHPFKSGRYTFMHNGGIPKFAKIKRDVCNLLRLENYLQIDGSTDSEHIFALFLNNLPCTNAQVSAGEIADALNKAIGTILDLAAANRLGPSSLNITVTDGVHVIVSRFRNSVQSQPPSLYYSVGSDYTAEAGKFTVPEGPRGQPGTHNGILVSSCPLSMECVESGEEGIRCVTTWQLIPENHMMVCSGDPLDLTKVEDYQFVPLQYPAEVYDANLVSSSSCSSSSSADCCGNVIACTAAAAACDSCEVELEDPLLCSDAIITADGVVHTIHVLPPEHEEVEPSDNDCLETFR